MCETSDPQFDVCSAEPRRSCASSLVGEREEPTVHGFGRIGSQAGALDQLYGIVIGRMHHVVIDCPDPCGAGSLLLELLGLPITYRSDDWS